MRIGKLAKVCNCPVGTIRYYEKIGLIPTPQRNTNGYRSYNEQHRKWLHFILYCRALGFTRKEIRRLSNIAHQSKPACAEVYQLLKEHHDDVNDKLNKLKRMERALVRLKTKCQKGTLNECSVVDELFKMGNSEQQISIQPGFVLVERPPHYEVVWRKQPVALKEISAFCEETGCRKVLVLGLRTKVTLSTSDILNLGKEIAKLGLQIAVAELHDASKEDVRYLENVVNNLGAPMQFFDNEPDALDWLGIT